MGRRKIHKQEKLRCVIKEIRNRDFYMTHMVTTDQNSSRI